MTGSSRQFVYGPVRRAGVISRALNPAAGERSLHTGEVVGSIPTAPTIKTLATQSFSILTLLSITVVNRLLSSPAVIYIPVSNTELTAMASPARASYGDYIFQRPGSSNWYVQLRSPDGSKVVSLKTRDKLQAQIIASPMVAEHRAKLYAARRRFETVWKHAMEPGREHAGPDGDKIVATDRELIHIGHNGSVLKIEPNGGRALQPMKNNESVGPANWRLAAAFLNAMARLGSMKRRVRPLQPRLATI